MLPSVSDSPYLTGEKKVKGEQGRVTERAFKETSEFLRPEE